VPLNHEETRLPRHVFVSATSDPSLFNISVRSLATTASANTILLVYELDSGRHFTAFDYLGVLVELPAPILKSSLICTTAGTLPWHLHVPQRAISAKLTTLILASLEGQNHSREACAASMELTTLGKPV
jgi:hypothetical protein